MAVLHRCTWAEGDALMRAYHDEEWGVPVRDSRLLWEMLMLEGFQAGLAWIIVLRKRTAFRKAFAGFDPKKVARFGTRDVTRLMADEGIIRARAKIDATIRGAQTLFGDDGARRAVRRLLLVVHRRQGREGQRPHGAVVVTTLRADLEGDEASRLQVRRPDDRLRVGASGGDRQRPLVAVFSAKSGDEFLGNATSDASLEEALELGHFLSQIGHFAAQRLDRVLESIESIRLFGERPRQPDPVRRARRP